jgi:outer membrane protein OmpA-like peptidoglycan-associated protein
VKTRALLASLLLLGCAHKPRPEHVLTGWSHGNAPVTHEAEDTTLPDDERETELAYHPPTIYFDFDSRALRETEIPKLQEMGDRLKGDCAINGYASPEGDAAYNLALSEARAHAIADYLALLHCKARLTVIGYGAEAIVSNNDSTLYWLDRRVEVRCL